MSQPMNRQQKRHMQRMGAINEAGAPVRTQPAPRTQKPKEERTGPREFLREVRAELRKVAWPTREEVRNYSIVVLITVIIVTTLVALLDWGFGTASLWLYDR
jgi:preprotein translocase subunit SecE